MNEYFNEIVMVKTIETRFCIGNPEGQKTLLFISATAAREKYTGRVQQNQLEAYIQNNFNEEKLHAELNSMSNQFLVVYADGEVAGYARVTSEGERPEILNGKSAIRIEDFYVLKKFDDNQIKKSLFEKCLSVCRSYLIEWISEYEQNPDLEFFAGYGFVKDKALKGSHELGLPLAYLIKAKGSE